MPPYAVSSNVGAQVASLCDSAVRKQDSHRDEITRAHAACLAAANHMAIGGEIERLLKNLAPDVLNDEEIASFLVTQRSRLNEVASRNAENEKLLQCFTSSAQQVKATVGTTTSENLPEDFSALLEALMTKNQENIASPELVEKLTKEVKVHLKEEKDQPLDDDIELVDTGDGVTQGISFKCPFTSALLEEPMKNKVCGHVYSKQAIYEYIDQCQRIRCPARCPTVGCSNTKLTKNQLEKDHLMEINLNRERRRLEKEMQDRASHASQIDDDEYEM